MEEVEDGVESVRWRGLRDRG